MPIIGDRIDETDETFIVNLTNAICPDGRIFLRAERSGTGTGRVYT